MNSPRKYAYKVVWGRGVGEFLTMGHCVEDAWREFSQYAPGMARDDVKIKRAYIKELVQY
jgi:hypothetical protein